MMNKSMLIGVVAGAAAVTAIGGVAGYKALHPQPTYADVVNVQPITKDIRTAHKDCREEPVTHQAPVRDQNRIAGTAVGAVLGGVLGNQIGGGNGKTVATRSRCGRRGLCGEPRAEKHAGVRPADGDGNALPNRVHQPQEGTGLQRDLSSGRETGRGAHGP